jgi:hypothetical protein
MIIDGNKYIWFELLEDTGKTQSWSVVNKSGGYQLGLILWYNGWRQYVLRPIENTEYNDTCLDTINAFMKRLNKEHRIL